MRNKILSLLVLLLTVATGAWAANPGTYSGLAEEIAFGGDKTLSHNYYKYDSGLTIVITSSGVIDGNGAIIDMEGANISHVFYISADNVTIKNLSIINYTGTGDAIYFSGSGGSVYNIGYDVALNRATANTWTFTQPGSDVVLTPIYAKTAAFATTGSGSEVKTLLPEAAEGVIAGTDAPLIVEGTVAFAGTSTEVRQGTVMYAVTAATATKAPELTSSDWKTTVPKASDIPNADDGAEVKVWYYIQGADAPQGEAATLDNTFNNSDICATPLTVTVLSNKFDLTLKAANANTIDATDASKGTVTVKEGTGAAVDKTEDIADGKLKAIKMGSEVKMTAKQGYKFRKVVVKKVKPAAEATAEDKGKLIGTDGKIYDTKDDAEAAGTTAVAMIIYIGTTGHATYNHGLALALTDEASTKIWQGAIDACSAKNTSTPVTGATWLLASKDQWDYMMGTNGAGSYTDLRDGFSSVGGSNLQSEGYWSSTEYDDDDRKAWEFYFVTGKWGQDFKGSANYPVRACLAF